MKTAIVLADKITTVAETDAKEIGDEYFSKGLNIITGETGAGKSILINAIDIAFGAKVGKEVIKTGAEKATIEITIINEKQNNHGSICAD